MYSVSLVAVVVFTVCQLGGWVLSLDRPSVVCRLPPLVDDCGGEDQNRWFFSEELRSCVQFVFHGCQQDGNNFATMEECLNTCISESERRNDLTTEEQTEVNRVSTSSVISSQLILGEDITATTVETTTRNGKESKFGIQVEQPSIKLQSNQSRDSQSERLSTVKAKDSVSENESFPVEESKHLQGQNDSEDETKGENQSDILQPQIIQPREFSPEEEEEADFRPKENDQDDKFPGLNSLEDSLNENKSSDVLEEQNTSELDNSKLQQIDNLPEIRLINEQSDSTDLWMTTGAPDEELTTIESKMASTTVFGGHETPTFSDQVPKESQTTHTISKEQQAETVTEEEKQLELSTLGVSTSLKPSTETIALTVDVGTVTKATDRVKPPRPGTRPGKFQRNSLKQRRIEKSDRKNNDQLKDGDSETTDVRIIANTGPMKAEDNFKNTEDSFRNVEDSVKKGIGQTQRANSEGKFKSEEINFRNAEDNFKNAEGKFKKAEENAEDSVKNTEDNLSHSLSDSTLIQPTSQPTKVAKRPKPKPSPLHKTPFPAPSDPPDNHLDTLTSVGSEENPSLQTDGTSPPVENQTADLPNQSPGRTFGKTVQRFHRPIFCSLHHTRGRCNEGLNRWYYDPVTESCRPFVFSGCGGNANNYETLEMCLVTCTGNAVESSKTTKEVSDGRQQILSRPMRYASLDLLQDPTALGNPRRLALHFFLDGLKRDFLKPPEIFLNPPVAPSFKQNSLKAAEQKFLKDTKDLGKSAESHFSGSKIVAKELRTDDLETRSNNRLSTKFDNRKESRNNSPMNIRSKRIKGDQQDSTRYPGDFPDFHGTSSELSTRQRTLRRSHPEDLDRLPEFHKMAEIHRGPRLEPFSRLNTRLPEPRRPGFSHRGKLDEQEAIRHFEERPRWPRTFQMPSPISDLQRSTRNEGARRPVSPLDLEELKNFRWVEQAIYFSGMPPPPPPPPVNLPRFPDRQMNRKWPRNPMISMREAGERQNGASVVLRKNSFIIETHPRVEHLKGTEMPSFPVRTRPIETREQSLPHPETSKKLPSSSFQTKDLENSDGKVNRRSYPVQRSFNPIDRRRPDVESLRRTDLQSPGSANGPPINYNRFRKNDSPGNWQRPELDFSPPGRRNYRSGPRGRSPPLDGFTFLQIFVDRDFSRSPPPPLPPPPPMRSPIPGHAMENRPRSLPPPRSPNANRMKGDHIRRQIIPLPILPGRPFPDTSQDESKETKDRTENSEDEETASKTMKSTPEPDNLEHSGNPQSSSSAMVCQQPVNPGPCRFYQPKWFFNREKDECEIFYFGGCDGNGNRFETIEDCLKVCKEDTKISALEPELDELEVTVEQSEAQSPENHEEEEEVAVFTQPIYEEETEEIARNRGQIKVRGTTIGHVGRSMSKEYRTTPGDAFQRRETDAERSKSIESYGHTAEGVATTATTTEKQPVSGEVEREADDATDLSKSFSAQYIAIVATLGVVGLAIGLMVIVSIVRLCKRTRKTKREHCIQEVIKTHLYGDLPHGLYSESPTTVSSAASSSSKVTEKEEKLDHK